MCNNIRGQIVHFLGVHFDSPCNNGAFGNCRLGTALNAPDAPPKLHFKHKTFNGL